MNKTDISEIKNNLKGKQIFLMPYCHADHAWCHSREWHKRRYLAVFDKMMELFEKEPDFKYFIDSWFELLDPCLKARPDSIGYIEKMLEQGRLALIGGHWSNIRFSHVGDETSIRNMVCGKRKVREYFPEARLDAYANLDVGIGHSQIPQLLKLAGYNCYFAWRPQKGLDEAGVPRSFFWIGLSGDKVLVIRHSYSGWAHGIEFHEKGDDDPTSQKLDFDYTVRYAWDRYLETVCSQPGLKTLSFCQGADDAIPLTDQPYGFERNIPSLINEWNRKGLGSLSMGTPHDVFDALLSQQSELPSWSGILDPTELCYHVARNGKKSAWWLRELGDRELILAEHLAVRASLKGAEYPGKKLDVCWQNHLTFCTHAVEFLFKEDFDNARYTMETVIREARQIQKQSLFSLIDDSDANDPGSFVIYNPLPEERREIVCVTIPNIDNSRRQPLIRDKDGTPLPSQIVYTGGLARDFDVLVETDLLPCGTAQVNVEWNDKDVQLPEVKEINSMDVEFASDIIKLVFNKGRLEKLENMSSGRTLRAPDGTDLLEPMSLPQEVDYWMPKSFADDPVSFLPESLCIEEAGPLRFRIMRTGKSGPHYFTQQFDLYRGRDTVDVETIVDVVPDSTNIVLGIPIKDVARITADIPFGVEERDISDIKYGFMGEGHYENIERRIQGIFWGRSWLFVQSPEQDLGIISVDGPRYFRRHGDPLRLLHFLVSVKPDRRQKWLPKTDMGSELGRHIFHHQLILSGHTWKEADMVKRSQQAITGTHVLPGRAASDDTMTIYPQTVRLSAFYREGDDILIRVVNMDDQSTDAGISLPFNPLRAEPCDFFGDPVDGDLTVKDNTVNMVLLPWQIMTLKINGK